MLLLPWVEIWTIHDLNEKSIRCAFNKNRYSTPGAKPWSGYAEEVAAGMHEQVRAKVKVKAWLRSRLKMQARQRPRINVTPSRARRPASRVRTSTRC